MNLKSHIIYLGIIIVSLLLWYNHYLSLNNQLTNEKTNNALLSQKVDTLRNKVGELVYQQDILTTTSKETIKRITDSLQLKIKNPSFTVHSTTVTEIDSFFIPYPDSIAYETVCDSCIIVPKSFSMTNPWFNITGSVVRKGININKITIPDEEYLVVSEKKYGFLNLKSKKIVSVLHKNPHVVITNLQSLEYKEQKNKLITPVVAGVLGGIITFLILK